MEYFTNVLRSMDDIDRQEWGSLELYSLYQNYDWLKFIEESNKERAYYHRITDEKGRILAFLPSYLIQQGAPLRGSYNIGGLLRGDIAGSEIQEFLSARERNNWQIAVDSFGDDLDSQLFPNLLCAIPHGYASGVFFNRELNAADRDQISEKLMACVLDLAARLGCASISFLFIDPGNPFYKILERRNPLKLYLFPDCWLEVKWESFKDYLYHFPKKKRDRIKNEIKRFEGQDFEMRRGDLNSVSLECLASLQVNLEEKYGWKVSVEETIAKLDELRRCGFSHEVFMAMLKNDIVGFSLFLEHEKILYSRLAGFEYEKIQKGKDYCYFNMDFYKPIEYSIQAGIKKINYGIASTEAKIIRGCNILPLYGFFLIKDGTKYRSRLKESACLMTLAKERMDSALLEKYGAKKLTAGEI